MYDDYLNDELDSYNDEIEGYNDDLGSLEDDRFMLKSSYESEIEEIDEYWDRENQYIKSSGIYTKEEVEQILANHEEIRRSKKAEVKAKYKGDLEMLRDERERILCDKEMAEFNRDCVKDDIEYEHLLNDGNTSSDDAEYYAALRTKQEEQAAYDDFIASLDMND